MESHVNCLPITHRADAAGKVIKWMPQPLYIKHIDFIRAFFYVSEVLQPLASCEVRGERLEDLVFAFLLPPLPCFL